MLEDGRCKALDVGAKFIAAHGPLGPARRRRTPHADGVVDQDHAPQLGARVPNAVIEHFHDAQGPADEDVFTDLGFLQQLVDVARSGRCLQALRRRLRTPLPARIEHDHPVIG